MRKAGDEIVNGFGRTLNFDHDSGGCVADRTHELTFRSKPIDVRSESNALNDSRNFDLASDGHDDVAR